MNNIFVLPTMLHVQTEVLFKRLNFNLVSDIDKADAIVFTGGEDINPLTYGQKPLPYSFYSDDRDTYERDIYTKYNYDKKFIGICRGAQLLHALNGGDIVQHINSPHPSYHPVMYGDEKVMVNSLHHQAIIRDPYITTIMEEGEPLEGIVWDGRERIGAYYCVDMFKIDNCFGVQFHPELMDIKSRAVEIFNTEVRRFLCAD